MNDYRGYSNYLMHYGVKGMKWHDHRYADPYIAKGFRSSSGIDETKNRGFKAVAVSSLRDNQRRQQAQINQRQMQAQAHQRQLALNAQQHRANTPSDNDKQDNSAGNQTAASTRGNFLADLENNFNGNADKLGEVGNTIMEMAENGNYWGIFGYYKNLDLETRNLLNERIKKWELPEALGNGDVKLGRQRVQTGEKILNFLLSNPIHQYNSKTLGALTGGEIGTGTSTTIRANEDAKDFRLGRRKRN